MQKTHFPMLTFCRSDYKIYNRCGEKCLQNADTDTECMHIVIQEIGRHTP